MTLTKTFHASDLAHCSCSDHYTKMPFLRDAVYTSGVLALAEGAGAFWLIDLIASHLPHGKRLGQYLPVGDTRTIKLIKCGPRAKNQAKVVYTITNKLTGEERPAKVIQRLGYCDFPFDAGFDGEVTLWLHRDSERFTLLLPSEH